MICLRKFMEDLKVKNEKQVITNTVMFDTVWSVIEKIDELKEVIDILDYHIAEKYAVTYVMNDMEVVALVNTGGSEGIYIDVYLTHHERVGEKIKLGTIKTLREDLEAYMLMGKLAGALTIVSENFLNYNYDEINKQNGME